MSFFNVDFATLCRQLLPVRMRKARHLAWLRSLMAPILTLHGTFMNDLAANNYYLAHTGQVYSLEAMLNDRFGASSINPFKIHNGIYYDAVYTFLEPEPRVVSLITEGEVTPGPLPYDAPVYLFTNAEIYEPGTLFKIYCPVDFDLASIDNQNEIRALVNKYRLVSRVSFEVLEGPAPPLVV